jgi:phage baseplate assembly protein W
MFRFLGAPYPIVPTPKGYLPTISGTETIKSDLLQLLLTYPGERIMLPSFGTPLKDLIYEPNDIILQERARDMVIEAINTWEPRIAVREIEVNSGIDDGSLSPDDDKSESDKILSIRIIYVDPQNLTEVDELLLQVPLNQ